MKPFLKVQLGADLNLIRAQLTSVRKMLMYMEKEKDAYYSATITQLRNSIEHVLQRVHIEQCLLEGVEDETI